MVQLEKILCFLFTLFVIYLVDKQCKIEGVTNLDSFDSCQDDPEWYTLGEGGKKIYCSQIGESASCYNFDERQQEGWERCLKTCGNCAKTKVTEAPQDNLAIYSGETGELYGKAGEVDDSRKFVGLGVGDKDNKDVRSTITSDQAEDIENIQERVETVEDLYDMLLGSVSSCVNCKQYTNQQECSNAIGCEYYLTGSVCRPKSDISSNHFISCNGTELPCDYTIRQNDPSNQNNQPTPSTTNNRNTDQIIHKYVKHECDDYNNCSLMFPTYEFNCNQLPQPATLMDNYHTLTYEPLSLNPKKCLSESYIKPNIGSNTISSKLHDIILKYPDLQSKLSELRISITELHSIIPISAKQALYEAYNNYNGVAELVITQIINLDSHIRSIQTPSSLRISNTNENINRIIENLNKLIPNTSSNNEYISIFNKLNNSQAEDSSQNDVNEQPQLTQDGNINEKKIKCIGILSDVTNIINQLKNLLDTTEVVTNQGLKQLIQTQGLVDELVLYNSSINNLITPNPPVGKECRGYISPISKLPISQYLINTELISDNASYILKNNKPSGQLQNWNDNDKVIIDNQSTTSTPTICNNYNLRDIRIKFENTDLTDTTNQLFSLYNDGSIMGNPEIVNLSNANCTIERRSLDGGDIIPHCYKLDSSQIGTTKEKNLSCARICNSPDIISHRPMSELSNYISVHDTPNGNVECRCFKQIPTHASSPVRGVTSCPTDHPYELLEEGKRMKTEQLRSTTVNTDEQMRDMCKSYFLLEKSLTGEDMRSNTSSTRDTSGLRNRISLYDMCPKQCKANNCPAPSLTTTPTTTP